MSLNQIFEGWKNHLSPSLYLEEQINTVASSRMDICKECPLSSMNAGPVNPLRFDDHCTACGCTLAPKTKCLSCSCPTGKWTSVVTPEEEQKMEDDEQ
jgi:hypothetical protein